MTPLIYPPGVSLGLPLLLAVLLAVVAVAVVIGAVSIVYRRLSRRGAHLRA